ncbi:MAG: hypothetical protein DMG04_30860 [Acidobacteria bacterium]|nr:MAG: hypothetical protein DMG04_30860 [Acidobacteriota bacterium]
MRKSCSPATVSRRTSCRRCTTPWCASATRSPPGARSDGTPLAGRRRHRARRGGPGVADVHRAAASLRRDRGEGGVRGARECARTSRLAEPFVSAVPPGTTLRALFISDRGDAYVDFSRDMIAAHPGGSTTELLTVYTIVNALTENLPAVHAVQLLVDGKEVDTIAGHVDLRRPLEKNLTWIQ